MHEFGILISGLHSGLWFCPDQTGFVRFWPKIFQCFSVHIGYFYILDILLDSWIICAFLDFGLSAVCAPYFGIMSGYAMRARKRVQSGTSPVSAKKSKVNVMEYVPEAAAEHKDLFGRKIPLDPVLKVGLREYKFIVSQLFIERSLCVSHLIIAHFDSHLLVGFSIHVSHMLIVSSSFCRSASA